MVVHGRDGMDELTVFAKNHVAEPHQGKITEYEVDPAVRPRAHRSFGRRGRQRLRERGAHAR